jgi:poly(A) polymerase
VVTRTEAEARLAGAEWLRREETQQVFALLDGAAGRTRSVGGVVRDSLLGLPRASAEIDFATELTPDKVMSRAGAAGIAAYPTGIEHGTVTLRIGELTAEVTTLREDIETDGRKAVVRFGTDWRRDAERRDFTMNALYAGPDGILVDPIGGIDDALARRVRFIGDADVRIVEDRLRVFRFFRFSASHGGEHLDPTGLDACRRAVHRLGRLSAERVGAEMKRMLGLPKVALTLQSMALAGLLTIGPDTQRHLTSYELRADPATLVARLALFIAASEAKAVQSHWRLSNAEVSAASAILAAVALLREGKIHEAAYRYPAALADAQNLAAVMDHWPPERAGEVRGVIAALKVPKFPVTGRDLTRLGMHPGRALGDTLQRLEADWIASGFTLDKRTLLARLDT